MRKPRLILAAAAAVAVLVAAGCSSNSDSGATTTPTTSAPGTTSPAAPTTPAESPSPAPSPTGSPESPATSPTAPGTPAESPTGSAPGSPTASPPQSPTGTTSTSGAADDFTCAGSSGSEVPTKLVLALVPSGDAAKLVETAKPLTDYLTTALGIPVTGVVSTDYSAAVEAMGADQAQIGLFAPLPMIQACQKYGAKIVLQSVRNGSATYHTQFFTNDPDKYCTDKPQPKKSNDKYLNCNGTAAATTGPLALDTLSKLKGATVALLDPSSTSGYIFPSLAMINAGVDPTKDITVDQLESHDQSVLAVYNGDAEVGVSYDDARDAVVGDKPDVGQKVVVFAYSDEIPNDGVVVGGKLTSDWQTKITQTLLDYSKTAAGAKVLGDIYQIDSFAPAVPSSLASVAEAVQKLGLGG